MSDSSDTVWGFLGIALAVAGGIYWWNQHEASKAPTLEQQRSCSEAAERYEKDSGGTDPQTSYYSHYNLEYGRCFVEAMSFSTLGDIRTIGDANEHTDFATYNMPFSPAGSQLFDCRTRTPGTPWANCKSIDEWKNRVVALMGNDNAN